MAEDFARAVEDGLKLAKRIYLGKDRGLVAPPKPLPPMEKSPHLYLPSAPMVYAVIFDPRIVDNPDIPSYQPHVHGRCDPPALIPLQMSGVDLDVDCYADTAFIQVSGKWRVHCVMASRSCDCRIAVPMGDQEIRRRAGGFSFLYEAEILTWSNTDFNFSYCISSGNIFGGVLLQSPSLYDYDQRDMFCIYLFPGSQQSRKVFRKEVIFVVDISDSMQGRPLESTKNAISTALSKLSPEDSFNIIAFSNETFLFSTSMELASEEATERATEWISMKYSVGGGTNMFIPLEKAAEMLSNTRGSIPIIFLVTDGAVEDEKNICDWMKKRLTNGGSLCPRIHTFGIGSFCNHYFLRMLAMIGRGEFGAACDLDSIEVQMQKLFSKGLSTVLASISIDAFDDHEQIEVYSSCIPDLSFESPLTICGRYQGSFPDILKAKGILGNLSSFIIDLKIERAKDIPLDRVLARQQIDLLTAQAWFSEKKQLEEKVLKLSIQTCNICEYTRMVLLEQNKIDKATDSSGARKIPKKGDPHKMEDSEAPKKVLLQSLSVGFGDLIATAENIRPGSEEQKLPEVAEIFMKATSNCCGQICNQCCCMCCIQCCSKMNNQCGTTLAQLCTALACFGCLDCCVELCCPGQDGQ
ncbi:inter-alpha-trypsin inhibitor heavy chain H4-like isoform X6 [Durio zibethinus]|uniref:Inter-alpha-trypsin inhibitor heavy chain H4-like isoform X6 n=1 Tax=Durio zibethinus TaxID=66656 RepID=A0A6P5ZB08_DURZI|nr:inter-alpha-trypsin inhibitor heavy chain H4-like isoform X6 [Durio zibethinus]